MDPLDALAKWLHGESRTMPSADSVQRVGAVERRYGIVIPEDFRRYLLEVAAVEDFMDDELTAWWGLARIRNIPDEYESEIRNAAIAAEAGSYLFFADYMLWCWAWAVCCSEGPNRGRIAVISDPSGFVAENFLEFADRYLRDPDEMACAHPPQPGAA